MCEHCEQQEIQTLSVGIHAGLNHLDQAESYYPGLNPYEVNYDDMKKAVVIAPGMRIGEAPYDKYIDELLEDMHQGLRTGIDKKEHIKSTLLKFSDRKFKDKDWWGNLTDAELSELMAAVRSYWLPHTAMLDAGLRQAYIFGKFSKALTENTSLEAARKKVMPAKLSVFDEARIDSIALFSLSREVEPQTLGHERFGTLVHQAPLRPLFELVMNHERVAVGGIDAEFFHRVEFGPGGPFFPFLFRAARTDRVLVFLEPRVEKA